jgi:CBS domain-containing protein
MRLRDILATKGYEVHTITSHATCDEVITELVRCNIGSLLIRDVPGGPILGIITERDVLRAQATHGVPLEQLPVAAFIARELITAEPEDDLLIAMHLMTTHRVRHLPVVHCNQLYGIVSIGDVVKAHHDELERENYHMRSYIQGGGSSAATLLA